MSQIPDDLQGPWEARMSRLEGCHLMDIDPDTVTDAIDVEINVVRRSHLPGDELSHMTNVWEVLYGRDGIADPALAAEWRRAHAVAESLNLAAWLVSLDDPGNPERAAVSLNEIVHRAKTALGVTNEGGVAR